MPKKNKTGYSTTSVASIRKVKLPEEQQIKVQEPILEEKTKPLIQKCDVRTKKLDFILKRMQSTPISFVSFRFSMSRLAELALVEFFEELGLFTDNVTCNWRLRLYHSNDKEMFKDLNFCFLLLQKVVNSNLIKQYLPKSPAPWDPNDVLFSICLLADPDYLPTGYTDKIYHHFTKENVIEYIDESEESSDDVFEMNENFSIFDMDLPLKLNMPPPCVVRKFTVCKSFIGILPEQLLRNIYAKKYKNSKISFRNKKHNYRHNIPCVINGVIYSGPFYCETAFEARNYSSTIALYNLFKNMSLHMRLPKCYQDVWFELQDAEKKELDLVQQESEANIISFINHLMPELKDRISNNSNEFIYQPPQVQNNFKTFDVVKRISPGPKSRKLLPVYNMREEIISKFLESRVLIISGETGSGKSTQVPQFVIESISSKVYCSQPRRISACSIAERVSMEWGESIGNTIGYCVRLDNAISSNTRLIFCTTGILLRMLESDPNLSDCGCVIVDEVHERTMDTDFLLYMLRNILSIRKDFKVILMSATLMQEQLSLYFNCATHINVPGNTFDVESFYLRNVIHLCGYKIKEQNVEQTLLAMDQSTINYTLLKKIIIHIHESWEEGAILVFLPGIGEIKSLSAELCDLNDVVVLFLHSSLSPKQQSQVFETTCKRKIVLSTNIAETGVTVPDVVFVVDTGKAKVASFDERTQVTRLTEGFISKASCKQRQGRAGRVKQGYCFKLYTTETYNSMEPYESPEVFRIALDSYALSVLLFGFKNVSQTFRGFIDPPSEERILAAMKRLLECKAIDQDNNLTSLGVFLGKMPIDVSLGKLIAFGAFIGCLEVTITIAAIISTSCSIFDKQKESGIVSWLDAQNGIHLKSDLIVLYNIYTLWQKSPRKFQFCAQWNLIHKSLCIISDARDDLISKVRDTTDIDWKECNINNESSVLIQWALASAAYPNICITSEGTLMGKNEEIFIHRDSFYKDKIHDPNSNEPVLYCFFSALHGHRFTAFDVTCVDYITAILLVGHQDNLRYNFFTKQLSFLNGWCQINIVPKTAAHLREFSLHLERSFYMFLQNPTKKDNKVVLVCKKIMELQ